VHRQRPDIVLRVATGPDPGPGLPAIRALPDPRPDRAYTYADIEQVQNEKRSYTLP